MSDENPPIKPPDYGTPEPDAPCIHQRPSDYEIRCEALRAAAIYLAQNRWCGYNLDDAARVAERYLRGGQVQD